MIPREVLARPNLVPLERWEESLTENSCSVSGRQSTSHDIYEAYANVHKLTDGRKLWFWDQLAKRGSHPDTPPQELAKRGTFMLICILTLGCSLLWAAMFHLMDRPAACLCPVIYYVAISGAMSTMAFEGSNYETFVIVQLFLIQVLPYMVHIALGGLEASGGVLLWSALSPLGAAFFRSAKESINWYKGFLACTLSLLGYDIYYQRCNGMEQLFYWAMNVTGVMTIIFMAVYFFVRALEEEFARSEALLHNMMPKPIARRIKQGENPIIDKYKQVGVLFADVVGFTKATVALSAEVVIEQFLQDFFHLTDQAVDQRKLTKVKTIGDAYMVCGGVEEGGAEDHVVQLFRLAGDIFDIVDAVNINCGTNFEIRIGVDVGPAIVGVLGVKRFAFDVWGDAVNTASRMESHGKPGYVHLTEYAYDLIKHQCSEDFVFEWKGGEMEVKSMGKMITIFAKPIERVAFEGPVATTERGTSVSAIFSRFKPKKMHDKAKQLHRQRSYE